ncbi:glycosyltransferase family 2 protein [Bacteroidia bacterium]|nr:glycosyltransferase family 2 protein [Bacteroidia bacterium]
MIDYTVIINCYNSENFVTGTLDSLAKQTEPNFKVLVYDNNSSDKTVEIVATFDKLLSSLKIVVSDEHTSLAQARNNALRYVDTKYFSFLDSDDLYAANRIRLTYAELSRKSSQNCIYFTNGYILHTSGKLSAFYKKRPVKQELEPIAHYQIYLCSVIFSSTLIKESFFDNRYSMCEEYEAIIACLKDERKAKVRYLNLGEVFWRLHSGSSTFSSLSKWAEEYSLILNDYNDKLTVIENRFISRRKSFYGLFTETPEKFCLNGFFWRLVLLLRKLLGKKVFKRIYFFYRNS